MFTVRWSVVFCVALSWGLLGVVLGCEPIPPVVDRGAPLEPGQTSLTPLTDEEVDGVKSIPSPPHVRGLEWSARARTTPSLSPFERLNRLQRSDVLVEDSALSESVSRRLLLGDGGTHDPERGDRDCASECQKATLTYYLSCLERDGAAWVCRTAAEEHLAECLVWRCAASSEVAEPDSHTGAACVERCEERALESYLMCLDQGVEVDVCRHHSEEEVGTCVDTRCSSLQSDCTDRCAERADQSAVACVLEGLDPDWCHALAVVAEDTCRFDPCGLPPATCLERCEQRFAVEYLDCRETGSSDAQCRERARLFVDWCVEKRCVNTAE